MKEHQRIVASLAEIDCQRRRFLKAALSGAALSAVGGSMFLPRLAHGAGITVKFAVYGALPGGASNKAQAFDITRNLQDLINRNGGIVACNNSSFGDPSSGNLKHFGALVLRSDGPAFFACEENQTIDFNRGGDKGNEGGSAPIPVRGGSRRQVRCLWCPPRRRSSQWKSL